MVREMETQRSTTLSAQSRGGGGPRRHATMREVAALAGVSIKSVSRVVNGEPGVSPDLARRVKSAARQLDYRPNLAASNLRRAASKTQTVGVILEDVSNPFCAAVHRAIGDAASERGVAVFASSLDEDPLRERLVAQAMVQRRVDGLVVMPTGDDQSYLRREMEAGIAIVFIDRPPGFLDADTVLATNRRGAQEAVEHLLEHGHRRIAFMGDLREIATAHDRYVGYVDALEAAGLHVDERLVRTDLHTRDAAEGAAHELLAMPDDIAPTALFTSQNLVTIDTVRALRTRGLQRLVALVGFDDVVLADMLDPGITVVAQDPFKMGIEAAELLFARLDGDRGPSKVLLVPTRLIARGSGEIRASVNADQRSSGG
jgi:LacI family transcriptional regulator